MLIKRRAHKEDSSPPSFKSAKIQQIHDFLLSPSGRIAYKQTYPPVMSKDPQPSSSDPSEIVPKVSKTQQETTKKDLWDLDDGESGTEEGVEPSSSKALPVKKLSKTTVHSKKSAERQVEIPPFAEAIDSREGVGGAKISETEPVTEVNRPSHTKNTPPKIATKNSTHEKKERHDLGGFENLGRFDKMEDFSREAPYKSKTNPEKKEETVSEPESNHNGQPANEKGLTKLKEIISEPKKIEGANAKENSESKALLSLSLSKIEKISLLSLAAILLIAGILTTIHFANRVPTRPTIAEKIEFPVRGERVTITRATTYWREPKRGENPDVVRRGTKLIPILELSFTSEKSGAFRVFFRDDKGDVIGDPITHTLSKDGKFTLAATAGFDDIGMHAAYRTGGTSPWLAQVYESPHENASWENFKKVLEMDISTDRR